ncbi:cation:proton antiporter domain-containing protein [Pseudopelagicola sp. nBUS_19]|uniref:cation:proton antiporter domain-containing protein n=1 Tax=Pseudopelagicola sp. nBUS_19 TaxID=3395316 RepID=UPI003EC10791
MEHLLVYIALLMLLYCLFSGRIGSWGITMPMVFLAIGVAFSFGGPVLTLASVGVFHNLAEITLALLLFADATVLRRQTLENIRQRTFRMLAFGLPCAIFLGAIINLLLLPSWPLWEACLLAALLAPTDAALGQSIQSNEYIPQALRDVINAESGLNDGLALPFVIFFAGLAIGGGEGDHSGTKLLPLIASQIGLGAFVGLAGGFAAGKLRNFVLRRNMMDQGLGKTVSLVLVGFIFFAADHVGGNSFIAVFIGGIAFANAVDGPVHHARHFLEGDGQFLAILSFFFIGMLFVPEAFNYLTMNDLLIVVISLFAVRPVAIWLSLIGTETTINERLFYGWFGPRGLATVLFAVFVVMDFEEVKNIDGIFTIVITAVLISAYAHGITAKYAPEIFKLKSRTKQDE